MIARSHIARALVLLAAVALARDARAQAGDLDILSRTVPPVVMIQFDTSGSMRNNVLPPKYITDRGAGSPAVWFNLPSNDPTNRPASRIVSGAAPNNFTSASSFSSSEDFTATCQVFPNSTTVARNQSLCFPGSTSCTDDNADGSSPQSGVALRCWNMPGGCASVPAGLTCSTTTRARSRTSGGALSSPYTVITFPDVSYTSTTDYPVNYIWWLAQEIYLGRAPQFIPQDRNSAAKQAVSDLVNAINVDGNPPRVKFGLARYSENAGDDNGGYVVVPADLNNKAALLATLATLPASGNTPLSETLVDVGRYLAGSDRLGTYPVYNRDTSGNFVASGYPPSPVTSSCEKLFIIAVTDGLPTADNNNHYTSSGSGGGNAFTQTFPGASAADGSYLNDVAAKLYATDLRTSLSGNQNVITYTVGFTVSSSILQDAATAGHGIYFQSNNATDLADSLTGAIQDIIAKNTTLTSATVPSTRSAFGNGFYTAYFVPSGRKSVWPGKLEAYTLSPTLVVLDDNNNPAIDPVTSLFVEPRYPHWDLGKTLLNDFATRPVYTTKAGTRVPFTSANVYDPNDAVPATGITTTMLNLSAADASLYPKPASDISITDPNHPTWSERLGDSIVDFVRGFDSFDENGDGSRTDVRPFVFGDVFHSSPVAVGPPSPFLRFEPGYGPQTDSTSFMGRFAHRDRVLYVGANDGLLHGVAAGSFVDPNTAVAGDEYYTSGSGREIFGYVPGFLLPKIKTLPRNDVAKQYYVDGPPSAADAWIDYNGNGTKEGTDWTTVLVTPMREGGEGVIALDITDPNASSGNHGPYPRLMWEFTHSGLGQTWSRPIVTRVKMRGPFGYGDKCGANDGDGDCFEQWVAIFGAGYENEANPNMGLYVSDPNNPIYPKSRGVYIVRIADGSILAHLAADPNSPTFSKMKYAMPAEPAVLDMNNDGFADVVYIGDLGGQMWKWDISAVGSLTAGVVPTTVWPAGVLFEAPVATIAAGAKHYHSIFQGAAAAISGGSLTLSFGSGERADLGYSGAPDPNDPNNPMGLYDDNNRFWVVKDAQPSGVGAFPLSLPIYETVVAGHGSLTDITNTGSDNNPLDAGYFFKVPEGEKFITDHLIFGGIVVTLSYLPDLTGSGAGGSCALGGTTFAYAWELANGAGVLIGSTGSGSGSGTPTTTRSQPLGNGAPTNPRITISRTEDGSGGLDGGLVVGAMVQTSTGELRRPPGLPDSLDAVEQIYWRQEF
jgi:Tfp pilus tip-associated adhesin PilY1